jgi:DNA-binding transcriptional ArsR family regulator
MDQLLWYLLAGTRGGLNRLRIIQALLERPLNANQLAERLGLDYRTVRHHLDLLTKNGVLARPSGDAYGSLYFLSGLMKNHMGTFEQIRAKVVPQPDEIVAKEDKTTEGSEGKDD